MKHTKLITASLILLAAIAGLYIGSKITPSPSIQEQYKTLEIASFETEVSDKLSAYLNIVVEDYWIEGNKIRSKGTVNWLGGEYTVSGAVVTMLIKESHPGYYGDYSVNVTIIAYGGILLLPTGTIDSDGLAIPTLGEDIFSFEFHLTCVYEK